MREKSIEQELVKEVKKRGAYALNGCLRDLTGCRTGLFYCRAGISGSWR